MATARAQTRTKTSAKRADKLAAAPATAASHEPASYEQLLSMGKAFFDANDVRKARDALLAALALDEEQLEPRLWLCRLAYKTRDWNELHARAGAYLAERPDDREVQLLFARGCNAVGDWKGSARAWRRVSEDRPEWPEARFQQARAEIRLDNHGAASQIADELSKAPEGAMFAARLYVELNEFTKARSAMEAQFRIDAAAAAAELDLLDRQGDFRGLAVGMRSRLDADLGAADADQLLSVSETLFRRAIGYERAGDLLEAYFDYEALLLLTPEDGLAQRSGARIVRALRARAQDHMASEALPEAAEALARVVRAAPSDPSLRRSYGRVLMKLREWPKAVAVWRAFVAAAPDDIEGLVQLARALDRSERLIESAPAWRAVQAREPDHKEAAASLATMVKRLTFAGRLAITEERFVEAYELFALVLKEDPNDEEAPRRIEQVGRNLLKAMRGAYKAHDLRRVVECGPAASALLPDDAEVQLLYGRAASGLRRYQIALDAWTRLAELDPAQANLANLQIARCHLYLGDAKKGRAATRKVLAADPANAEAKELQERFRSLA